jgi:hypothetical protein
MSLWITLGSIPILTVLIFPIYEHRISSHIFFTLQFISSMFYSFHYRDLLLLWLTVPLSALGFPFISRIFKNLLLNFFIDHWLFRIMLFNVHVFILLLRFFLATFFNYYILFQKDTHYCFSLLEYIENCFLSYHMIYLGDCFMFR